MQPTSYTFTFSADERNAIIFALGNIFPAVRESTGLFISQRDYLAMSQRIISARPDAEAVRSMPGAHAAAAIAAPPASQPPAPHVARDRWALNREGVEEKPAGELEQKHIVISSITAANTTQGATYWKVVFRGGRANCFDKAIAGWLTNALATGTRGVAEGTVYFLRNGKYLNLAGIRA